MPYADPTAQRAYQRQWISSRRAAWLAGKSCATCGATDNLEVDHIDPSKKVTHRVWSWSKDRRDAELAKCQVLCADCHDAKSLQENPPVHGTYKRYEKGCRCEACHSVALDKWRRKRLRQRAAHRLAA